MRPRSLFAAAGALLAMGVGGTLIAEHQIAWGKEMAQIERRTGGHIEAGPAAIRRLGCGTCHTIPGVPDAQGRVGPPLTRWAERTYIGGVMPNTAENLILWIRWPQGVLPRSGMPNMGASETESRDIAAYLLTLD
jgi:cytochrome c